MKGDSFLDIDIHQLHLDWQIQPKLLYEHAMKLADARQKYAEAKVELELVEAETDSEIRKYPFRYDLGQRVTETVIKNAIVQQKNVQKAQALLISAKHDVDVLEAAVSALDHKKKALENMVQLRLNELYAEPRMPRGQEDPTTSHAFDKRSK